MAENPKNNNWFDLNTFEVEISYQTRLNLYILLNFAAGIITLLSIFNLAGSFGSLLSTILNNFLGRGAILIAILFFYSAIVLLRIQKENQLNEIFNLRLIWGIFFMVIAFQGLLSIIFFIRQPSDIAQVGGGGLIGYWLYPFFLDPLGPLGALVILFCIFLFGFFLFTQKSVVEVLNIIKEMLHDPAKFWDLIPDIFEIWHDFFKRDDHASELIVSLNETNKAYQRDVDIIDIEKANRRDYVDLDDHLDNFDNKIDEEATKEVTQKTGVEVFEKEEMNTSKDELKSQINTAKKPKIRWQMPEMEFLKSSRNQVVQSENIEQNKIKIAATFDAFGIKVDMLEATTGPTISQYKFRPDSGVKLSRISSLQQDLALALAAPSIRMELPIPGESAASIEIPNKHARQVRLRDIINTKEFRDFSAPLPIAVGKNVFGDNLIYSLAKAPHLLVAGATGSGKSVWINSLILSLLYRYSPKDLQLILVDMKMVELILYENIPHLLTNVITEAEKAINALKWLVFEMDKRYKILKQHGKRNILDYNHFAIIAGVESLPYIVCIIDELADLMMQAKNEVEPIIARLTAMSRAVGIHLVLGTQRPDVNVVTGLIKTNIPSRICFAVVTQIDSRVILDMNGGESLLGMGDGLIKSSMSLQPIRFQGANVEEVEVKEVVASLLEQVWSKPEYSNYNDNVTEPPVGTINVPGLKKTGFNSYSSDNDIESTYENGEDDNFEEYYQKAKELITDLEQCSVSIISGNLNIDVKVAKRIVDQLEANDIITVSPHNPNSYDVISNEQ
jgi:DNA segregation ATPase FtsK/SpoIIIE, S-DNA-T family